MYSSRESALKYVLECFLAAEFESSAQAVLPESVCLRFAGAETGRAWDQFDTDMCYLVWLEDCDIYREVSLAYEFHVKNNARCHVEHEPDKCAIPIILQAINELLEKYEDGETMGKIDRYIFEYYLCLEQGNMIVTDGVSK